MQMKLTQSNLGRHPKHLSHLFASLENIITSKKKIELKAKMVEIIWNGNSTIWHPISWILTREKWHWEDMKLKLCPTSIWTSLHSTIF
jgi:hypothetical protein